MKSSGLLEERRRRAVRTAVRLTLLCVLVPLVLAATSSVPAASSSPAAVSDPSDVYEVRSIPTREFGVPHPTGLAHIPTDGSLVVAGSRGKRTRLVRLTLYEDLVGSLGVRKLSSPSSLSFDPTSGRLAAFDAKGQLALASPGDRTVPSSTRRGHTGLLPVGDPRAAVFDPKRKAWYVLDGREGAIVRDAARGGGRPLRIALDIPGARSLRGLAYNPGDGLLYVTSPADARLYALDGSGRVRKVYSLKQLRLRDARAILFAPSADPTDDAAAQHLYIADAGGHAGAGRIVEATLAPAISFAATTVSGTWIKTIDTSQYSPPSPDPAGITYVAATDQFLISDSEVDEMAIYQGKNLFTATRSGSGTGTGTTLAFSEEATGIGHDPATNTLFISDDDHDRIYVDAPGPDSVHGTADDQVSSVNTAAFGSADAEGVEFDPATGHLFIADGVALEVYRIDPVNSVFGDGNDVVTHFDVGQYGARDAEGIGIDPQRGLLLVVDPSTKSIYELTKNGTLIRIIDCRGIPTTNRAYAGVTMAPTSNPNDEPTRLNFWIVDRQVDNGTDPNENDGKLYEVSAPSADTPPTVSVTAPAEGATVSGTVNVEASASDNAGVTQVAFAVGGTSIGTDTNGADGWSVPWNSTTVADGARTVTATATDTIGQIASDSNGVIVDNTPPAVTVTSPAAGATVSGTITVQANASDARGITQVAFSIDGTNIGTDTNGTNGWSVPWSTTTVANGAHTVTATATDTTGHTASYSISVTVNNVVSSPVVTITAPAGGAKVSGNLVVTASAVSGTSITQVAFSVDGASLGTDTNGADGWSVSWNTTMVADGAHTLAATATDTLGQTGSDSNGVTVDNTAPTVSIVAPAPGAVVEATISVEALATDAGSVASVQFFVGAVSIGTDSNGSDGWAMPWNTTTVADGAHNLTATARDAAGNASTSPPVQVTVNNPTLVVLSRPIGVGVDDADELQSGSVRRANGDLELGTDQGVPTTVGLRFTGVTIPQGATITRAYVQFTTDENGKNATSLVIRAESSDNSAAIATTAFNISSRPRTTASTAWSPPKWQGVGTAGPAQQTPDLSAVMQELVNRPGWATGNALMIIVTGSGRRTAESFEGGPRPVLHVEYTVD
jgi:hypothetical protein